MVERVRLFLGTQGFSYSAWVGPFYPPGTKPADYLSHYATQFNSIELDTTFYASPRRSTVEGWRDKTPAGFRFTAKFPQKITHEQGLVNSKDDTYAFVEAMSGLGDKLGVLAIQMPPHWTAQSIGELETFLSDLPSGSRYTLEVRHRSWLTKDAFPKLTALLERFGVALCLVQHSWMPALDTVTAPFAYIRWLGRREDIPDDDYSKIRLDRSVQLDRWAEQVHRYLEQGLEVYGYANNHYMGHSPATLRTFQQKLKALEEQDRQSAK